MGPINNNNFNWERALFKKKGGGSVNITKADGLFKIFDLLRKGPLSAGMYELSVDSSFALNIRLNVDKSKNEHWYFCIDTPIDVTPQIEFKDVIWNDGAPEFKGLKHVEISILSKNGFLYGIWKSWELGKELDGDNGDDLL